MGLVAASPPLPSTLAAAAKQTHSRTCLCFNQFYSSCWICLQLLLLLALSGIAASGTIVKTLPGFSGNLPFTLETGYVSVGDMDEVQLFYYFVESQRSPALDPLMIWLTGGPGCSALSAFFYESGPLNFDFVNYNGSLPQLTVNPYAWTQNLNIIYLDAPVGTGFSYSTTSEGYYVDDYKTTADTYQFLRKWLMDHPQFLNNLFYVGGDSYSGIPVPMIVQEIYNGNEAGLTPQINLKGYVLGNPKTDNFIDDNSRIPFAHRLTLISDALYVATRESCNGDYINVNSTNEDCINNLDAITELLRDINLMQVLEPTCVAASPKSNEERRSLKEDVIDFQLPEVGDAALWCRYYNYVILGVWANENSVREALHIRNGTKGTWNRCNESLAYTKDVSSSVAYHHNFTSTTLRALIYSGDHDMSVTHIGTQNWISLLNLTLDDSWRAWFVDGQVAGYTEKYLYSDYSLNYATIKGAGHVAPEYKPKECYNMINRWLAYYPL